MRDSRPWRRLAVSKSSYLFCSRCSRLLLGDFLLAQRVNCTVVSSVGQHVIASHRIGSDLRPDQPGISKQSQSARNLRYVKMSPLFFHAPPGSPGSFMSVEPQDEQPIGESRLPRGRTSPQVHDRSLVASSSRDRLLVKVPGTATSPSPGCKHRTPFPRRVTQCGFSLAEFHCGLRQTMPLFATSKGPIVLSVAPRLQWSAASSRVRSIPLPISAS